jgi:hypothetical protein
MDGLALTTLPVTLDDSATLKSVSAPEETRKRTHVQVVGNVKSDVLLLSKKMFRMEIKSEVPLKIFNPKRYTEE